MNDLQTFNHPMFGELPVIIIDGVEWFGAREAASALSFIKPHDAINNHVEEEDSAVHGVGVQTGYKSNGDPAIQKVQKKFVNESGLYDLIFGAAKQGNNPEIRKKAKNFRRWVTSDVLPSIRKHGAYATPQTLENMIDNPEFGIKVLTALQKERREKNALQIETAEKDKLIGELKPKAAYTDIILKNKGLVTITQIAKDYGMTAQGMNDLLHKLQVQYKQSKQWLLYKKYADKGYVHSNTIPITRSDGTPDISMSTKWTQKGRLFIYELLKSNDVLPVIERDLETKRSEIDG
ncbi:phage antirepressor [Sporosarcina limicola]|uniref:Prophage antirepressor-like protein n=1 Tax=Sporosarcina limicola TaxID=34101 RepID=A0A927R378_9BACL|nr:phage antirepressor KilAC domain-containing protein [Sporosarcina limicola]MBE1554776.1 prophage antirepressor-like protein [Sporosarcina limicola]